MHVFFFHYNKPASQRSGRNRISLHHRGVCHIVDNVVVNVPTYGCINKRQPRFVMKGKCREVIIVDDVAVVN